MVTLIQLISEKNAFRHCTELRYREKDTVKLTTPRVLHLQPRKEQWTRLLYSRCEQVALPRV